MTLFAFHSNRTSIPFAAACPLAALQQPAVRHTPILGGSAPPGIELSATQLERFSLLIAPASTSHINTTAGVSDSNLKGITVGYIDDQYNYAGNPSLPSTLALQNLAFAFGCGLLVTATSAARQLGCLHSFQ